MSDISLTYLAPSQIKSRERDWRSHSTAQIDLIALSLSERGCIQPPLLDSQDRVVCGAAVVLAARDRIIDLVVDLVDNDRAEHPDLVEAVIKSNKLRIRKLNRLLPPRLRRQLPRFPLVCDAER